MAKSNLITLILLSLFSTILASPFSFFARDIIPRQTGAATTCDQYSMWANYSTIGTNSSYRAAFMKASPHGTDATTSILDTSTKMMKAGNLTNDVELNTRCPNSTEIALAAAPVNFTMGIVGGFTIKKVKSAGMRVGGDGIGSLALVAAMVGAGLLL